jgi:dienelactone hydrolase
MPLMPSPAFPAQWRDATDPRGLPTREFRIEPPGARPVTGALWLPPGPRPDTPLVLCGHGASGDRYQAPIPALARRFTEEAGCALLSLDGPVHGLRQVGPGGRTAFFAEIQRPGCIDDMVADWGLAIDAARAVLGGGGAQLAYFGLSMGSIFGIPLLATRSDVAVATLGLLGSQGAVQHLGERLLADAARIHCPVLFLMQLEDELFGRDGCLALFDALGSADKRLHANPGLHPEVPLEEIDFCFSFLRERLAQPGKRQIVNLISD